MRVKWSASTINTLTMNMKAVRKYPISQDCIEWLLHRMVPGTILCTGPEKEQLNAIDR